VLCFIDGWTVQWKAYEPGAVGAVNVAVPPAGTLTSKPPAESAVTVCGAESLLVTVIMAPGFTVSGPLKAKPEIVIESAAAAGALPVPEDIDGIVLAVEVVVEGVPEEELEQAAALARAKTVTAAPNMREDLFMLWTRMRDRAGSAERKREPERVSSMAAGTEVLDEAALRLLYA
jgi:hypothetical protein